jgi:hypothetical protein
MKCGWGVDEGGNGVYAGFERSKIEELIRYAEVGVHGRQSRPEDER